MKKLSNFLIPAAVLLIVFIAFKQFFGSGPINPLVMGGIIIACLVGTSLLRPKKKVSSSVDTTFTLLGDFGKEAFSYDESLSVQFQSAVSDFLNSMPKSATKKLEKLQPLCKTDADTYAVSVALGMIKSYEDDYASAIKLFNRAVVLHPTAQLAETIASAQQRIGELEDAIDSYEFALDLDPEAVDIRAKLATAYVADAKFEDAITEARLVLEQDETHASALATCAICYGVLDNALLCKNYTDKAAANGYSAEKISTTITALKKKYKKTLESMN